MAEPYTLWNTAPRVSSAVQERLRACGRGGCRTDASRGVEIPERPAALVDAVDDAVRLKGAVHVPELVQLCHGPDEPLQLLHERTRSRSRVFVLWYKDRSNGQVSPARVSALSLVPPVLGDVPERTAQPSTEHDILVRHSAACRGLAQDAQTSPGRSKGTVVTRSKVRTHLEPATAETVCGAG